MILHCSPNDKVINADAPCTDSGVLCPRHVPLSITQNHDRDTDAMHVLEEMFEEENAALRAAVSGRVGSTDDLSRRLHNARANAHEIRMNALARGIRALRER